MNRSFRRYLQTSDLTSSGRWSAYRLSKETFIPQTRISQIIKEQRRITADTAFRFSKFFGTSAKFWLGLQDDYDLEEELNNKKEVLDDIKGMDHAV